MAMKRRRSLSDEEPDITPMIDVVFLLIIFFMVAMSIAMVYGISIKFPINNSSKNDSKESKSKKIITVFMEADQFDKDHKITYDGFIKLNGEEIALGTDDKDRKKFLAERKRGFLYLKQQMRDLIKNKGYSNESLTIKGDVLAHHSKIVTIIDMGKAAGIKGFSLTPPF